MARIDAFFRLRGAQDAWDLRVSSGALPALRIEGDSARSAGMARR